jgi:predicted PurR-regulated permease PerM
MRQLFLIGLLLLLGYLVYLIFQPFLVSLTWAVVLVVLFFPVHRRVGRRIRGANRAALVSTFLLTALIVIPMLTVATAFATQAIGVAQRVQEEWQAGQLPLGQLWQAIPAERILDWLAEQHVEREELSDFVTHNLQRVGEFLARRLGGLARNLLGFLFNSFVGLFACFYLFRDGPQLMQRLRGALPMDDVHREALFYTAYNVLYASVLSGIVVAAVQGTLGGLVFWILGIGAPVLWGVVMGFLSLLPVFGPWLVWLPAALSFVLSGDYAKAVTLAVVGAFLISMVDNVLRPILLSGQAQLNGLLVFISILGGVAAFGMLGIVLGPILVALADAVLYAYTFESSTASPAPASD